MFFDRFLYFVLVKMLGHYNRLVYFALVENEPIARVRFNCLQAMVQPCGKPPAPEEDE